MSSEKVRASISRISLELIIYTLVIFSIFIMGTLHSGIFRDEKGLIEFASSIFNARSYVFYAFHIFALIFVIGIVFVLSKVFPGDFANELCRRAVLMIPLFVYFVGSNVSGVMFSVTTYLFVNNKSLESISLYYTMTTIFAVLMFITGYFISRRMEKSLPKI
ncbi:TPA: hypothetical protein RG679_000715 [Vibrio diabolicus]|nr:hypothetical protein [Vibrio diabolicus]